MLLVQRAFIVKNYSHLAQISCSGSKNSLQTEQISFYLNHFDSFMASTHNHAPSTLPPASQVCFLTVGGLGEVDISISQGAAGDHVPADPDGEHRAGRAELLVQHRLGDVGVQVAHIQRSHGVTARRRVHGSVLIQKKKKK